MDSWQTALRIATGIVRRRKRLAVLALLLALAGLLPPAYYLSKEPPRFTATATIFVEMRPSGIPIFQDLSPGRPLSVQLAILESRSLAESVLESLPPESLNDLAASLYSPNPLETILDQVRTLQRTKSGSEDPRGRMLAELQNRMRFSSTPAGIVSITTDASTPRSATTIANTYVDVLLARTRSFNQDDTRVSREFLEKQLAEVKPRLQAGEQRLQSLAASHGGMTVPDRNRAAVDEVSATERSLAEVESNRKMVGARLEAVREKLETQKGTPVSAKTATRVSPPLAPEVQRLRNELARLESTLLELRGRYTDEHPRVALAKERIAEFQRDLARVVKEKTPSTPEANAVPPSERITFSEQVVALETAFHTLTAQEEALRSQAKRLRQNLTGLSQEVLDYSRVVREVESDRNLFGLISDKLTAARIREQGEMQVVKIIDPASRGVPASPTKRVVFLLLALSGAFVVGGGVPAAVEWSRRTIENEDDVTAASGLPVLASLPLLRTRRPIFINDLHQSGRQLGGDFVFTEAFHTLRVAVQLAMRSDNIRTLIVTSALANEGKSTVVLNLARAFREAGQAVVVTDTDFQRPTLHSTLDSSARTGFLDALENENSDVGDSLVPVERSMWFLPRGSSITPHTREALTTDRVKSVLDRLSSRARVVLCDSSPVLIVPESLFLASSGDAVLLVAKAGTTRRHELARAKTALEAAGARIIGVVLNELPLSTLRHYYDRYYAEIPSNGNAS